MKTSGFGMNVKELKQRIEFNSTAKELYNALMDSKKHSEFTGEKANISSKVGGKIKAYGNYITGVNLELIPEKKIVQSWRASDWPEGLESKVSFEFKKESAGKTALIFTHSGIPAEQFEEIKKGWNDWYWKPLKEYLALTSKSKQKTQH